MKEKLSDVTEVPDLVVLKAVAIHSAGTNTSSVCGIECLWPMLRAWPSTRLFRSLLWSRRRGTAKATSTNREIIDQGRGSPTAQLLLLMTQPRRRPGGSKLPVHSGPEGNLLMEILLWHTPSKRCSLWINSPGTVWAASWRATPPSAQPSQPAVWTGRLNWSHS